ncbi:BZ3500_MvSof-1268-A1-R1_Chr6-3g08708 [Microbotryum saponariae]|uniref:BZ3500_MvSof-1268-A1-R1_Chr6-3g08708 protein n=1 Tax=Microbotryum saponariae TaxID=289078 RepID=A0A2X0KIQ8_9BASI|nr:BZ3500_MvSof-1268-A1-R1_Chr6-3g08708 [Microbotryum saponariae]
MSTAPETTAAAVTASSPNVSPPPPVLVDIGSNLGDPVFQGSYHGKQHHPSDFLAILSRARLAGVKAQLLTGDCVKGAQEVIELTQNYDGLYATVGCHPCRAYEFDQDKEGPEAYLETLSWLIESNRDKVKAVGECGLDYDRLNLCPRDVQLRHFPPQLTLARKFDLPLFLHSRAAHEDFIRILKEDGQGLRGVVHSHSGSLQEALDCIELGYFIGINGCSLKTEENVECVRALPLDKLMVESDCPWCEIRPSHASHPYLSSLPPKLKTLYIPQQMKKERWVEGKGVKGRSEPSSTGQVAWVVAQLKGVSLEEVASITTENTRRLFGDLV